MKISEQVTNILKVSREARNSDKELFIIYMQKSGMHLSDGQLMIFRKMPSLETIRRTRQKIQEEGKYPADEVVDSVRFHKYLGMKDGVRDLDPEQILESKGQRVLPWGS